MDKMRPGNEFMGWKLERVGRDWMITDPQTGLTVYGGRTRKQAIAAIEAESEMDRLQI